MSVESKMTVSGCDTVLPQVCTTRWYWADKSLTSPSAGHSKRLVIAVFPLELPQQQKNEKSDTQNLNFTHIYSDRARSVFWSWVMPFDFTPIRL